MAAFGGNVPELPEVECLKNELESLIVGKTFSNFVFNRKNLRWPIPQKVITETFLNTEISSITRISKYLLIGNEVGFIVMHLGMSGNLIFSQDLIIEIPHIHAVFQLKENNHIFGYLHFIDPRRFGSILFCKKNERDRFKLFKNLGPDPIGSIDYFHLLFAKSRQKKTPIKSFLMNAHNLVGVGNIYACESLFVAKIHPLSHAGQLPLQSWKSLEASIRLILTQAIEAGGTSFKDYKSLAGNKGNYKNHLMVYGRKDLPCRICETPIIAMRQTGRSTFFCPKCQKF